MFAFITGFSCSFSINHTLDAHFNARQIPIIDLNHGNDFKMTDGEINNATKIILKAIHLSSLKFDDKNSFLKRKNFRKRRSLYRQSMIKDQNESDKAVQTSKVLRYNVSNQKKNSKFLEKESVDGTRKNEGIGIEERVVRYQETVDIDFENKIPYGVTIENIIADLNQNSYNQNMVDGNNISTSKQKRSLEEINNKFDIHEENKLHVLIQCMPVKNDTATLEILNKKLQGTLTNPKNSEECNYFDLNSREDSEITIRIIERQCNDRNDGIVCYGLIKNNKIFSSVKCGLGFAIIPNTKSNTNSIQNGLNYFVYSVQTIIPGCINAALLTEKINENNYDAINASTTNFNQTQTDGELNDANNRTAELDIEFGEKHHLMTENGIANVTQVIIFLQKYATNKSMDQIMTQRNPLKEAIENAYASSVPIFAIDFNETLSILIWENKSINYYLNSKLSNLDKIDQLERPYCLIYSNCDCEVKNMKTTHEPESSNSDDHYDGNFTGIPDESSISKCEINAQCSCYTKNSEMDIAIYKNIKNIQSDALYKCFDFLKTEVVSKYSTYTTQKGKCLFEFEKSKHQNSTTYEKFNEYVGYILMSGFILLIGYFVWILR
ncbi:hypothetical protein COBT_000598 [Conglomerata obtusa]